MLHDLIHFDAVKEILEPATTGLEVRVVGKLPCLLLDLCMFECCPSVTPHPIDQILLHLSISNPSRGISIDVALLAPSYNIFLGNFQSLANSREGHASLVEVDNMIFLFDRVGAVWSSMLESRGI